MRAGAAALILACLAMPGTGRSYEPRVNYQLQCMGCHLADGTGQGGRVPSLRGTLVPFSMMSEGREFVVRVPGVAQSTLSDTDTAALLNWMARNLSDERLPADFKDYTASEVQALRSRPLAQVEAVRRELLQRIADARARETGGSSLRPGARNAIPP
jgi:hypothetical protein